MSTINIFGSTGLIGQKTLNIINNYFPEIKIIANARFIIVGFIYIKMGLSR